MMSRYPPLQPETLEQQQEKKQHPISRKPSPSHVDRSTLMGSCCRNLEGQRLRESESSGCGCCSNGGESVAVSRRQKILQVKWKQMLRRNQLTTGDFLKESFPAVLILLHQTVGSTVEVVFYFNSSSTDSCSG